MTKQQILDFIKTKKLAVISTYALNGFPESALVGFGETDDFEIVFGTNIATRKYKNLQQNNKVSFVIGWDLDLITVQLEGHAFEMSPAEIEKYVPIYHKKSPSAAKYKDLPGQSYWKVKPTWVRYTDISKGNEKVFEFNF